MVIIKIDREMSLNKLEEISKALNAQTGPHDDYIVVIPNYCYVVGQF